MPYHINVLKVMSMNNLSLPTPIFSLLGRFQKAIDTEGQICLGLRSLRLPDRGGSLERLHRPNRHGVWLRGIRGKPGFKMIPRHDAFASMRAL
jgi:hypothetical protein